MNALARRVAELVAAAGPMSVADYFLLCLSDPVHGYYMTREPFGRAGDFVTAPEISQMFGELVGVWLVSAWRALGRPHRVAIVELGPGRGTLARDVSRTLSRLEPDLQVAGDFVLVETSPRLRAVQAETLRGAGAFRWLQDIGELPRMPMLVVGNEFFDALPVRQFVKAGGAWRERCVGLAGDGSLAFMLGAATLDPQMLPEGADSAPEGTIHEVAPARAAVMEGIARHIAGHGGGGLFIDYGHLRSGFGDTLQAVRAHRPEGVLDNPGEADLTSHVDFAALADVARGAGAQVHVTTQGDFLLRLGLLERAGRLGSGAGEARQEEIRAAVERLAGPEQMGELFKVMAVLPAGVTVPPFG